MGAIEAVVAGAEGGIYYAVQLAVYYDCPENHPSTTNCRRKKAAMQKRLCENGLSYIRSKILTKDDCTLDDFESHRGYVVKLNNSGGSGGVFSPAMKKWQYGPIESTERRKIFLAHLTRLFAPRKIGGRGIHRRHRCK